MYRDHLKFCVVCINGRRYVCNEPTSCLVQPIGTHGGELCTLGVFALGLGFLNCDDICMCVVNKQFELLEFVFDSVYVVLQYAEIALTFLLLGVCPCVVSVVMWLSLVCL